MSPGSIDRARGPLTATTEPARRERILVIDDEENIRSTIEEFLSLNGYQVETAPSGKDGLDLLGRNSYDLVVSDLHMPDVDGLAVIEWIRETQPTLPVLVMTGHATVENTIRALRLGAYDYLLKPFRLDEIERTIENCLEKQRLERRNTELAAMNERLREIEHIKDDLLATVSHEFRTPLTGLRGFLGILRAEGVDNLRPHQLHAVDAISENVRRLDEMIANLLALVEIQDGSSPPIREPIALGAFVREILAATDLVRGRGQLRVEIEPDENEVLVDRQRFPLVVTNLLDNAFKFARETGEADVLVRVRHERSSSRMEIHDAGIGIPPALRETIFDRFMQGDMSSTREHQGAGLGLAVVRSLIKAHGGTVQLLPPLLGGASFGVTLPAARPTRTR